MRRLVAAAIVLVAVGIALTIALARRGKDEGARCGTGFAATRTRCLPAPGVIPAPLVATPYGIDAPDVRVLVPAATVAVGPSDWEAEGRVQPRQIHVEAFRIDAFEATRGAMGQPGDTARAASGVTRDEAAAFCTARAGRLPTEDEWIVAAISAMNPPRRYPWGDTGAVCRRGPFQFSRRFHGCARGIFHCALQSARGFLGEQAADEQQQHKRCHQDGEQFPCLVR